MLSCLHVFVHDSDDKKKISEYLDIKGNPEGEYRLESIKYHVNNCNNPVF
ncbi:MAG: hypothetical protein IE885_08530 [Campylobacterales bacterium]|nr:hypothetical protein [Campylobacterales bacterium]